ncbi:MAG: DUF72 domain-containing protein [Cuniculiplasma sp.]
MGSKSGFFVGCSGWSYGKWKGPFYPIDTKMKDMLHLYSEAFSAVEIDSTFYGIPSSETVKNWYASTVKGFVFCPKLPRLITHDKKLKHCESDLSVFMERIQGLKEKLGPILIQLPPWMTYDHHFNDLNEFVNILNDGNLFAMEFRDMSWFREDVLRILRERNIITVWADIPYVKPPPWITGNSIYLRLVGDRSIGEDKFGTVALDKGESIVYWANLLRRSEFEKAYIFANNHFEGFSPLTANKIMENLALEIPKWPNFMGGNNNSVQKTLF